MRIDAIGLPIDRLQLRPNPLRQPPAPTYVPLVPPPASRTAQRSDAMRPVPPPAAGQAAAAAQAAAQATVVRSGRTAATPGSLLEQLRRQRLSLGRMLGDVNRQLAEPISQTAN
ncbi:MAG: hypothetical protein ACM3XN_02760 [Chloroflexota bacterium]